MDAAEMVWGDQGQWSATANKLKSDVTTWRSVTLVLAITGAVLATRAVDMARLSTTTGKVLSALAAVAFAIIPVVGGARLGTTNVQSWIRARSASEALQSERYLYLTHTPPYIGEDAGATLVKSNAVKDRVRDLAGLAALAASPDRPLPQVRNVDSYLNVRVRQQIDGYYRPKAGAAQAILSRSRTVELILSVLAACLGAVAATLAVQSAGAWIAVLTTVGAAIATHMAATHYEHQVVSYSATASRLEFLIREWLVTDVPADKRQARANELIKQCEDAILGENEAWMAEWTNPDQSPPEPQQVPGDTVNSQ